MPWQQENIAAHNERGEPGKLDGQPNGVPSSPSKIDRSLATRTPLGAAGNRVSTANTAESSQTVVEKGEPASPLGKRIHSPSMESSQKRRVRSPMLHRMGEKWSPMDLIDSAKPPTPPGQDVSGGLLGSEGRTDAPTETADEVVEEPSSVIFPGDPSLGDGIRRQDPVDRTMNPSPRSLLRIFRNAKNLTEEMMDFDPDLEEILALAIDEHDHLTLDEPWDRDTADVDEGQEYDGDAELDTDTAEFDPPDPHHLPGVRSRGCKPSTQRRPASPINPQANEHPADTAEGTSVPVAEAGQAVGGAGDGQGNGSDSDRSRASPEVMSPISEAPEIPEIAELGDGLGLALDRIAEEASSSDWNTTVPSGATNALADASTSVQKYPHGASTSFQTNPYGVSTTVQAIPYDAGIEADRSQCAGPMAIPLSTRSASSEALPFPFSQHTESPLSDGSATLAMAAPSIDAEAEVQDPAIAFSTSQTTLVPGHTCMSGASPSSNHQGASGPPPPRLPTLRRELRDIREGLGEAETTRMLQHAFSEEERELDEAVDQVGVKRIAAVAAGGANLVGVTAPFPPLIPAIGEVATNRKLDEVLSAHTTELDETINRVGVERVAAIPARGSGPSGVAAPSPLITSEAGEDATNRGREALSSELKDLHHTIARVGVERIVAIPARDSGQSGVAAASLPIGPATSEEATSRKRDQALSTELTDLHQSIARVGMERVIAVPAGGTGHTAAPTPALAMDCRTLPPSRDDMFDEAQRVRDKLARAREGLRLTRANGADASRAASLTTGAPPMGGHDAARPTPGLPTDPRATRVVDQDGNAVPGILTHPSAAQPSTGLSDIYPGPESAGDFGSHTPQTTGRGGTEPFPPYPDPDDSTTHTRFSDTKICYSETTVEVQSVEDASTDEMRSRDPSRPVTPAPVRSMLNPDADAWTGSYSSEAERTTRASAPAPVPPVPSVIGPSDEPQQGRAPTGKSKRRARGKKGKSRATIAFGDDPSDRSWEASDDVEYMDTDLRPRREVSGSGSASASGDATMEVAIRPPPGITEPGLAPGDAMWGVPPTTEPDHGAEEG